MAAAEATFRELRSIRQRVAEQVAFDSCVRQLEERFREQGSDYEKRIREKDAQLALLQGLMVSPDIVLRAGDGSVVYACKDLLVAASPVIERMLSSPLGTESATCDIQTNVPVAALRYCIMMIHLPKATLQAPISTLLHVLDLSAQWEMNCVLRSVTSAIGSFASSDTHVERASDWCAVMHAAKRHLDADVAQNTIWRELYEEAASALATTLKSTEAVEALASSQTFKDLDVEAVCEVARRLPKEKVELPTFELDTQQPEFQAGKPITGAFTEQLSWLSEGDFRFRVRVAKNDESLSIWSQGAGKETFVVEDNLLTISHMDNVDVTKSRLGFWEQSVLVGPGKSVGFKKFANPDLYLRADGKCLIRGVITIAKRQRQYELLQRWLIASGCSKQPLSTVDTLLCLRGCACGFDVTTASADELQQKLSERQITASGSREEMETRALDELYILPIGSAVHLVAKSLAGMLALQYTAAVEDSSFFELDAASVSDVWSLDTLQVDSEATVMEHAVRWASRVGRTDEVISKVLPLIRFPLCSLMQPSKAFKALQRRSAVLTSLVQEAITLQMREGRPSFTPAKHTLIAGVLAGDETPPRNKRRKLCTGDKVLKLDAISLMSGAGYTAAKLTKSMSIVGDVGGRSGSRDGWFAAGSARGGASSSDSD